MLILIALTANEDVTVPGQVAEWSVNCSGAVGLQRPPLRSGDLRAAGHELIDVTYLAETRT